MRSENLQKLVDSRKSRNEEFALLKTTPTSLKLKIQAEMNPINTLQNTCDSASYSTAGKTMLHTQIGTDNKILFFVECSGRMNFQANAQLNSRKNSIIIV
jgi:hypothetical protein